MGIHVAKTGQYYFLAAGTVMEGGVQMLMVASDPTSNSCPYFPIGATSRSRSAGTMSFGEVSRDEPYSHSSVMTRTIFLNHGGCSLGISTTLIDCVPPTGFREAKRGGAPSSHNSRHHVGFAIL